MICNYLLFLMSISIMLTMFALLHYFARCLSMSKEIDQARGQLDWYEQRFAERLRQ